MLIKELMTYQTSQLANITDTTYGAVAQYDAESDLQAQLGGGYIGQLNGPGSSMGSLASTLARATWNRMVFRDFPRTNQNLQSLNIVGSIDEVIRQMRIAGASILAQTITATPSDAGDGGDFTGNGNGVVVTSVRRPFDGLVLENAFAEILTLTCNSDSFSGGSTEGNEGFTITGEGLQGNVWAFDWPLGSNCQTACSAIDGNADNSSGNILTNSGFESWTGDANEPDNWSIHVGDAGTNFFEETTIVYDGDASLRIDGELGEGPELWQQFDNTTGTVGTLSAARQYAFNVFMRRGGTAIAGGTLHVELVDDAGDVIQDNAGADNSLSFALSGLTTEWASFSGVFRTPSIMPDEYHLRFRVGADGFASGRSVYIDKAALGLMTQTYISGTYLAVFAGSSPFLIGDYAFDTITNSRGAAGTLNTFATLLQRLFFSEVMSNEILFPSSATPTISDALIGFNV